MTPVRRLLDTLARRGQTLAIAESCTGGGILKALTDIPGSSSVVWGGVVAYANDAKMSVLGVSPKLIASEGAVSPGVAEAMARGVQTLSGTDWTAAVTGIAGPDGGDSEKPAGSVWIAWCDPEGRTTVRFFLFKGDRLAVREQAAREALLGISSRLDS